MRLILFPRINARRAVDLPCLHAPQGDAVD